MCDDGGSWDIYAALRTLQSSHDVAPLSKHHRSMHAGCTNCAAVCEVCVGGDMRCWDG